MLSQQSEKTSVSVSNVTALDNIDDKDVTFVRTSILYKPKRSTLNLGLGRRLLSPDEKIVFGLNAFLDYAPKYGHQRASVGAEVKSLAFEMTANRSAFTTALKSKSVARYPMFQMPSFSLKPGSGLARAKQREKPTASRCVRCLDRVSL